MASRILYNEALTQACTHKTHIHKYSSHTAALAFYFLAFCFLCNRLTLPLLTNPTSNCGEGCNTLDDCAGQLICISGECNDDPDVGTNICGGGSGEGGGGEGGGDGDGNCQLSGTLTCSGESYTQHRCSPTITSSTQAILTLKYFTEGGSGGDPSKCDEIYHSNSEPVVALSTGWFDNRSRCEKMIRITASNGKSTTAKVVDECDSVNGCDREHAGQPPCRNNIVDGSQAVRVKNKSLGLWHEPLVTIINGYEN